jgi:signal transduction histidine kinase
MNNDMLTKPPYIPNILIIDDISDNLRLLDDILKREGYRVRPALHGEVGLQAAVTEKPDLILLDIMMPGIDGFEVCRRLKTNSGLKDIPVIFISALNDTNDIVKAFTAGAVDYITKPFQAEEVKARVSTHLKLSYQNRELLELNTTKDKFFSIIAHDLRSPMSAFLNLTKLMANPSDRLTDNERRKMTLSMSLTAENTFNLLENLLKWSQMVRGNITFSPQKLNLKEIITECENILTESAREKSIRLVFEISGELQVFADTNMLQTVIRNLLSNAIKFTPNGGNVTISAELAENNMVSVSVKDTGIGISATMRDNLFSIEVNTKRPGTNGEPSTGLGLLLCKEFVEKHGGKIRVESVTNQGSLFNFTIPALAPGFTLA